ncbi:MAG: hypothetical protein IJ480_00415 [Clostridia bacterium]|nr:hypothetical protein [Clostridia bacterium]
MELYFLNGRFETISSPVDTAVSVVWSLQYHECGVFSVVLPLTGGNMTAAELLSLTGEAVYLCDSTRCGRIETVICRDNLLTLEGRMLECLLYDRTAPADTVYTGTAGEAVLAALEQWAGDLPLVREELPEMAGTGVRVMEAGESLGKFLHRILKPLGASYRVTLAADGRVRFGLLTGEDRSLDSEPGVSRAIFSEEFGNIASLEQELYRGDVLNRMYVEGSDGTIGIADRSSGAEQRREGYKKAADIRPADYDTAEAYLAALVKRGEELLDGAGELSRLSCVAEYDTEPKYGRDYRLGDICEIRSETMGIRMAARLTAMDVVYEGGTVKLYPYFGDDVIRLKTVLAG